MRLSKKDRLLLEEWDKLKATWKFSKFAFGNTHVTTLSNPVASSYNPRQTANFSSLSTPGGQATKKADKVYTGTSMVGVATLHKSNAVPVFNLKDAEDISRMRR